MPRSAQRRDRRARGRTPRGSCTTNTNQPRRVAAARPGTGARGPRCPPAPRGRARRPARAAGEHLVEPLELGQAERAGDVRQAVVEAEPVVVEPVHVRRAALVALASRCAPCSAGVAERDHAALAGGELLVGVEAEHGGMAARADRASRRRGRRRAPRRRPRRSAAPSALERRQVGRVAEDVDRQQRRRALGHRGRGRAAGRGSA